MNPGHPNYEADGKQSMRPSWVAYCLPHIINWYIKCWGCRGEHTMMAHISYIMDLIFQEVFSWWQLHQMTDVLDQWSGKTVPTVSRWWKLCQLAAVVSTAVSYFTDNIYQCKKFSNSWHEHSL